MVRRKLGKEDDFVLSGLLSPTRVLTEQTSKWRGSNVEGGQSEMIGAKITGAHFIVKDECLCALNHGENSLRTVRKAVIAGADNCVLGPLGCTDKDKIRD